jgi:hypothetical protein
MNSLALATAARGIHCSVDQAGLSPFTNGSLRPLHGRPIQPIFRSAFTTEETHDSR